MLGPRRTGWRSRVEISTQELRTMLVVANLLASFL